MRALGAALSIALAMLLGGCPAIVGIDNDYTTAAPGPDGGTAPADGSAEVSTRDGATGTEGGAGDSSKITDGSPRDRMTPTDACPASCAVAASPGWQLVAFNTEGSKACPSDLTPTTLVELKGTGSCSCGSCTITTPPDCEAGKNTTTYNSTGGDTCSGVGDLYPGNEGACFTNYLGNAGYMSITAAPPKAGICSATATANAPPTQSEIMCMPKSSCANEACEPDLGPGFQTCLYQDGTQNCPSAGMTAHLVGTGTDTNCTACDCSVSTTGCTGSLAIYPSTTVCTGTPVLTMNANGTCYDMSGVAKGDSYIYTASATGVSCNAGTSSATVALKGPATICCP
jgi:hypothetical protein